MCAAAHVHRVLGAGLVMGGGVGWGDEHRDSYEGKALELGVSPLSSA